MSATIARPTTRARLAARIGFEHELWALIAAFALLRAYAVLRAPVHLPDSLSYTWLDFLGNQPRLWTVPLVYNVFASDTLREVAQLLLAIVSWSTLTVSVHASVLRPGVRRVATVAVLLLGLVPQVTGWDSALLSESIATSTFVLLVALLLRLRVHWSPGLLAACLATSMFWEFTRQQNAIIFIVLTPFAIAAAVRWLPRPTALFMSAALCLLAGWGAYDTFVSDGDRPIEHNNTLQILENRIAPDPAALKFFVARGLPVSPEVLRERGAFIGGTSSLYNDQRLISWIDHRWKSAYAAYLVRHPLHTLSDPLRQTPTAISSPVSVALRERPALPPPLADLLWSTTGGEIVFWLAVGVVAMFACYRRHVSLAFALLPAALLLFTVVGAEITWTLTGYNSGPELARQFMPVAISARLAILLLIVFAADRLGSVYSSSRTNSASLGAHT